jgi:hypothetical protein
MVILWHRKRGGYLECGSCEDKPFLRDLNGCNGPSAHPFFFPRSEVNGYTGERAVLTTCPAKYRTPDVRSLVDGFILADKRVPMADQEVIPSPALEALRNIASEFLLMQSCTFPAEA